LGSVDPMEWLESLARRQGVPSEELTTSASLDVPIPDEADVDLSPIDADQPKPERENPAAWLDSLAVAGGFEDAAVRAEPSVRAQAESDMSIEAIEQAIREGVVTPEQIRFYQEYQMERAAQRDDVEDYDVEVDIPAEAAEMPDWLAEMKAEAEAEVQEEPVAVERPPLETLFEAPAPPPAAVEFPDWLSEDEGESETVESIFADEATSDIEIDYSDPWVEAFDEEYERGGKDVEAVPDWYLQNTSDPERMAIVDDVISSAATPSIELPEEKPPQPEPVAAQVQVATPVQLAHAELPSEVNLPAGERQALPTWISVTATQAAVAVSVPPPAEEPAPVAAPPISTPDWLQETEEHPVTEVPDWLSEIAPAEDTLFAPPTPAPAAVTVSPPQAAPPIVSGTLDQARTRYRDGDMEGSLAIYEGLVRTSQVLADVANDLDNMAKEQKNNPVVYRVLGDSLMRQGRLQEALNTYREALNWL
ncbi:MAG: tetratricopeptide repeat protein, partial [Anaerolineae bacterium]|nr:tetratricopeptide repeat protein [Anaerolineae bacterium]